MAEPGDPTPPEDDAPATPEAEAAREPTQTPTPVDPDQDHDALIGFSSAAALAGEERKPDPAPVKSPRTTKPRAPSPPPEPSTPDPRVLPAWAIESDPAPRAVSTFGRAATPPPVAQGVMGLYAVYALILFAVPTLGVSALIALLAVTGRPAPEQPLARSHFIFQQRTLWAAAVIALTGVILIVAPFALGVITLFVLAVWTVVRGAWGVLTLKSGRTIANPRQWLISETV